MAAIKAQNVKITKQDEKKWNIFFNEYFPVQWLNEFTVNVWNLYDATDRYLVELLTRVNNTLERYNRETGKKFPHGDPTLLKFINTMEEEARCQFREMVYIFTGLNKRLDYTEPFILNLPEEYSIFCKSISGQGNLKGGAEKKQNQARHHLQRQSRKAGQGSQDQKADQEILRPKADQN